MFDDMPSLCEAYAEYFKIGAAVAPRDLVSHRGLLKKHFNSITHENALKFAPIHPEEDRFDFDDADQIFAFAEENGIAVRAHAPVWHSQTPDWVFQDGAYFADREKLIDRLRTHVEALAARYGDMIYAWDVVNEAIVDEPGGYLRPTKWYTLMGPDYIEIAFRTVREFAPKVQLFYNDYNEWVPHKRDNIVRLVRELQDRGVPIDGIGMQQHVNITDNLDDIKRAIEAFASTGLVLHVTELDVSLYPPMKIRIPREFLMRMPQPKPALEQFKKQHKMYVDLFEIYRSYSDVIKSVTTWGVADDYTWLDNYPVPGRKNYPLMFYADHSPKPFLREIAGAAADRR